MSRTYTPQEQMEADLKACQSTLDEVQRAGIASHNLATQLRGENAQLREALAFAASVIKSGEPWTPTCEQIIGGALLQKR